MCILSVNCTEIIFVHSEHKTESNNPTSQHILKAKLLCTSQVKLVVVVVYVTPLQ